MGTYSKYANIISGKTDVVTSTPTQTKYANIISSYQKPTPQPEIKPIQVQKEAKFPKLKQITTDFIKDIKLAKGYARKVEDVAKRETGDVLKQYISDTFKVGVETAKRLQKITPAYKSVRRTVGEPVSFVENLQNYLGVGLGALELKYRTTPIAPLIGATAGTIRASRQNLQKILRGEDVKPEEVLLSGIKESKKGVTELPFVGEALTDNPVAQQIINTAFVAIVVASPFIGKKLDTLKLKGNEMAKVSKSLGVKPNASMKEISQAYKNQIVKYKDVFAGRGSAADIAKVKELNEAYNILKKAGVWERQLAGLFGKVKPEEFKALAIPEKTGISTIENTPLDPKVVIDSTLTSNITKTKAGQQALKLATTAQQNGNKIIVNLDGEGDVVITTPEGNQIGLTESKIDPKQLTAKTDLLVSHEGSPDKGRVEFYKEKIQAGEQIEPIKVIREGEKYGIEDGKHRFQAYKELGIEDVPIKVVEAPKPIKVIEPKVVKPKVVAQPKPKPVKPKVVKVPREQIPVGKGEEKVSRLEARVTDALDKTPQQIKDLLGDATFNQLSKKENIAKASKYVTNNPEDAIKILTGEIQAPKGILRNAIYVAMENLAKGDVNLARRLASLTSTRLGQEIGILTELDPNSPVKAMNDIIKVKEESFKRRYKGRSPSEVRKKTVSDIKKNVKAPSKYDWNKFLEEIKC